MIEKLKNFFTILTVIVLLPYVCTVFFTGEIMFWNENQEQVDEDYEIRVKINEVEESMDIEEYLIGMTAIQIPVDYPLEAIKAQMVAARSSLRKQLLENADVVFEEAFMDMATMKNTFGEQNFDSYYGKLVQASEETRGEVAVYEEQIVELPYHAVSAGWTRDGGEVFGEGEYEYIKSVESSQDTEAEGYMAILVLSTDEILQACQEEIPALEIENDLASEMEIMERDGAGYVKKIKVGNINMSGELFRSCLNLNSSCFTLQEQDGDIRIITKGLGHGVGMSQYGAKCMAESNKSYKKILNTYFEEISIEKK